MFRLYIRLIEGPYRIQGLGLYAGRILGFGLLTASGLGLSVSGVGSCLQAQVARVQAPNH